MSCTITESVQNNKFGITKPTPLPEPVEEIKGIRKKQKTLIKINEDGAIFRSYINGKTYCHYFSMPRF